MHPATQSILRYFSYQHLPADLAATSKPFHDLAHELANNDKLEGPEMTVALRKLLEAKDAAVRSAV